MDFNKFQMLHSETIGYCQLLENDLKWIYSFITGGDIIETRDAVSKFAMGKIINVLKKIDKNSPKRLFSNKDYKYLRQLKSRRDYWCHQCYIDFLYEDNYLYSSQYKKCCSDLEEDNKWFYKVYKIVEKIKVDLNNS